MIREPAPEAAPPIRVVLVDDQPLVRAGLRTLLELPADGPRIEVAAEAADGAAGVAAALRTRPDVVLLDIRMPVLDGLGALAAIRADRRLDGVAVVMLTTYDTEDFVLDALAGGARGFLVKDDPPEELRLGVARAAAGAAHLSPAVTGRVVRRAVRGRRPGAGTEARALLTERELEVLAAVGRGRTNDEIAAELFLSPATAKTYVSRLLAKLGCRDRVALVLAALEAGLA